MTNLPYIQPERELHYNLGVVLLILSKLAKTKKNKKVLTIDKIQSFYFLATRPAFLNKILNLAGRQQLVIDDSDYYTVDTLSVNVDELFDRERLLIMIRILSAKKFLLSEYSNEDGFLFDLTDQGKHAAEKLKNGYFHKMLSFIEQLTSLHSLSPSKLNGYINTVLKQGI